MVYNRIQFLVPFFCYSCDEEIHGYQLNEFIDAHLGSTIQLKKSTAYNLLNKMTDEGWISYREEQASNRPPRRVYTITSQGETAFQQLLRESLTQYHPVDFQGDIPLIFLDAIPGEEAIALLQNRRPAVETLLQNLHEFGDEHQGGFRLIIEHQKRYLSAELDWLDEVVAHIEAS